MKMVLDALDFAARAHDLAGNRRRYSNAPYIVHPAAVAMIVKKWGQQEHVQIAALLHDVVEDAGIELAAIGYRYGAEVAAIVADLSIPERYRNGPRPMRHEEALRRLAAASRDAQIIKCADIIDNCRDLKKLDPKYAKVYFAEKREILAVMREVPAILVADALEVLDQ